VAARRGVRFCVRLKLFSLLGAFFGAYPLTTSSARASGTGSFRMVARQSTGGHRFYVGEPVLPRIADKYLHCVVYLYPSAVAADDGADAGGSGFLVGVPTEGLRQNFWMLYAVTNKHVIKSSPVLRMNTVDGKKTVLPTTRKNWVVHPAGDDIAACAISLDPKEYKFHHVPRSDFLSKEIVGTYRIGPGDETFMIGRFINHEGKQLNLPTVRFGNIGQMPWEPIKQRDGFEQESFLVETRSIGGYSGSPIFVHIPILTDREDVVDWSPPPILVAMGTPRDSSRFYGPTGPVGGALRSHGPWLLGIDYCYMNNWTFVCRENGEPVNPGNPAAMQVAANTGMAAAVPAWKLAELLDSGPLADHRRDVERQVMEYEAKNPPVATLTDMGRPSDADGISQPPDEANPSHREDFTSLLNAAARKRPQDGRTSRDGNADSSDDS
jgi:hypothetical protein